MVNYCSACLSTERLLKNINDLSPLEYIIEWFSSQNISLTFLCWECEGILNKLHTFKLRCLAAQDLIREGKVSIKQGNSLSTLVTLENDVEHVRYNEAADRFEVWVSIKPENIPKIKKDYDSEDTLSVNSVEIIDDETTCDETKCDETKCDETSCDETRESNFKITFEEEPVTVQTKKHKTTKTKEKTTKNSESPAKISNAPQLIDLPEISPSVPIKAEIVFYNDEMEKEYDSEETLSVNSVEILDDETSCDETSRDETSEPDFKLTFEEEPVQIGKHKTTKTEISKSPAKISNALQLTDLPTVTPSTSKCSKTSETKEAFFYINYDEKNYIITRMTQDEMMKCWLKEVDEKKFKISFLPFKCEFCFQGCFHDTQLKEHLDKYHNILNPYKCPICQMTFPSIEKLEIHRECHYKMYKCRSCDYSDHRIPRMIRHTETEHYVNTYYCPVCGEAFLSYNEMRYHREKTHHKKIPCEVCNKDIPPSMLKIHIKENHKSYEQCPHCNNSYIQLKEHIKLMHSDIDDTQYCLECDKNYVNRVSYEAHIRNTHNGDTKKKYICEYCRAEFYFKTTFESHIATHTNTTLFTCDQCGKGYRWKHGLRSHIRQKHLNIEKPKESVEKPYQCDLCQRQFAHFSALCGHYRGFHKSKRIP